MITLPTNECTTIIQFTQFLVFLCGLYPLLVGFAFLEKTWLSRILERINYASLILGIGILFAFSVGTDDHYLGSDVNYWTIGSLLSPAFLAFILFFFLDFLVPPFLIGFISLLLAVTAAPYIPFTHVSQFLETRYNTITDIEQKQKLRVDFVIVIVIISVFLSFISWGWIPKKFITFVNKISGKKYDKDDLPVVRKFTNLLRGLLSTTTASILCIDFVKCFMHTPSENFALFFNPNFVPPESKNGFLAFYMIVIAVAIMALFVQKLMAYLLNETLFTKPVTKKAKSVNYIKISEFINLLDSNKDQMAFTIDQENQMMLKHKLKLLDRVNKLMLRPDKNARDQFTAVCNQLNKLTPVTCQKAVISWIKNNQDKPIPSLAGVKRAASSRKRGPTISEIINEDMNEYLYHTIKKSPGDAITLIAIANIFNVNIKLVTSLDNEECDFNYILITPEPASAKLINNEGEHLRNLDSGSDNEDLPEESVDIYASGAAKLKDLWIYHLNKKVYGGLIAVDWDDTDDPIYSATAHVETKRKATECDLETDSDHMMIVKQSGTNLNRLSFVLSILTGLIWIIWLIFFGNAFNNFWSVTGYIIFVVSEAINFILGLIYYVNFLRPVSRRWKSLHKLQNFNEKTNAACMIFHYSEPLETTQDTLRGCLEMKLNKGKVSSSIYICDDGYWMKPPPPAQKVIRKNKYCTWWTSLQGFLKKVIFELTKCCRSSPPPKPPQQSGLEMRDLKDIPDEEIEEELNGYDREHKKLLKLVKFIFPNIANQPKKEKHPETKKPYFHSTVTRKMVTTLQQYVHSRLSKEEQEMIDYTMIHINVIPSLQIRKELFTESTPSSVGEIKRRDCSVGSFKLLLQPREEKYRQLINDTKVYIVARLKPPKHHNKAGNINNCLFNEMKPDPDTLISFFDNDMKPEPLFFMRTFPFFYKYNAVEGKYEINKEVGYVQTPQHFTEDTIAPVLDYLASKNSVFFQAIQKGRDGYNSCAFAGTNATFRAGAVFKVGGFPYGSVTEDALCGRKIHEEGYISIYAEEKLVIGEAPTTVAQSMKQRMRWCKGSIQILFLEIFGLKPEDLSDWEGDEPEKENTDELLLLKKRREEKLSTYFVQKAFSMDTMLYPVSAITAVGYMFVAALFVWSNQSPIQFTGPGSLGYMAFILTFGPYFLVKSFSSLTAYWGKVSADEIWVTQQCWFSYAFGAIVGIFDAMREHLTGRGLSWGVTGEAERRNWLEYFNMTIVFLLVTGIVWRFVWVLFIVDPYFRAAQILIAFGGIFFAGTVIFQMWPMVSMSIYERLFNAAFKGDEKQELALIHIPTQFVYIVLLIIVIIVGIVLGDSKYNPCAT